jgi:hypothetical protein
MNQRLALPNRRNHITQKVRIAGQRTLYIIVHDDEHPAEIFLRVKGPNSDTIVLPQFGPSRIRKERVKNLQEIP